MPRFLFGPIDDTTFTDRYLSASCEEGLWATFSAYNSTLEQALANFDSASPPDALLVWVTYASIPSWVWSVPFPVVALARDAQTLWHPYQHLLPLADIIVTDAPTAIRLRQSGRGQARSGNLCGLDRDFLGEIDRPTSNRDIDIIFVSDLNPAIQTSWPPCLSRLRRLAERYKVVIASGLQRSELRSLMRRSKLLLNFSRHGECNGRALEAAAMGALLLQEAENQELPNYLTPGSQYISYSLENLESVVDRMLADEYERLRITKKAKERVRGYSFAALIEQAVGVNGPEWSQVQQRASRRLANPSTLTVAGRVWQSVSRLGPDADPTLISDLKNANDHYGLAVLAQSPAEAEPHLAASAGGNRVAAVGWASALCDLGRVRPAIQLLREVLRDFESHPSLTPAERDTVLYPARFDQFRVMWEQSGYDHSNDAQAEIQAKMAILRCRAFSLLAAQTGELAAYQAAADACPQLPEARSALGCALAQSGRLTEAIEHLQFAIEHDPFDRSAAHALAAALTRMGEGLSAEVIESARRSLAQVAPGAVPVGESIHKQVAAKTISSLHPLGTYPTRFVDLTRDDFVIRFGLLKAPMAPSALTLSQDYLTVFTLVAHENPSRVLVIGTDVGQLTADLTALTPSEAIIYSVSLAVSDGTDSDVAKHKPRVQSREEFAQSPNYFETAHKALHITAYSQNFDFTRYTPLDLALIDGTDDHATMRSQSLGAYHALRSGGYLVWHESSNSSLWAEFERSISELHFPEPVYRIAGTQLAFLSKGEGVGRIVGTDAARLEIAWEGQFDIVHSLSAINYQVCTELLAHGHGLALVDEKTPGKMVYGTPRALPAALTERFGLELPRAVTVRHRWPPDFTPPKRAGALVLMQPWEYGRLPRAWIEPLLSTVDEVWAYSRSVMNAYVSSGVPEERLALVPPGVDLERFRPKLEALPLSTSKGIKLLFLGGTIPRKGFDCLLAAYGHAFSSRDDVCLVVKELGASTFYAGQTAADSINSFRADPAAPEILYLTDDLIEDDLARLYTACAALVHPYRGEGFGLPVLEAMACGKPVVVTAGGPTDEFVPPSACWRIPARVSYFPDDVVGDLPTVGRPWWLEPDIQALSVILKRVVADGQERDKRGRVARHAALGWPWTRTASIIEDRVRVLRTRTPLRLRRNPQ